MKPTTEQAAFINEVVAFGYAFGLSPSFARVMAWLLVCEPEEQSAEDIQAALGLSVGSVNAAVNLLQRIGLVSRGTHPGDRRYYYRLNSDSWQDVFERRVASLGAARAIADQGLKVSPGNQRLIDMRNFYSWIETQFADIMKRIDHDIPPAAPRVDQTSRKP